MNDQPYHAVLTLEGKQKVEEELHVLKTAGRKQVAEKIEASKEMGDISENAEYAAAKDEQAFMEAHIAELENILAYAEVVEAPAAGGSTITVGSTVSLTTENGVKRSYTIVGYNEASPADGKISNESPLGQALMGKHIGDDIRVETPNGSKSYTVESVG